jgi:membrane fusion protein, multidrug efflux system
VRTICTSGIRAILLTVFLFSVLLILGCRSNSAPGSVTNEEPADSSSREEILVTISVASNGPFQYLIQANGKIKSLNDLVMVSESGGKLIMSNARAGKYVISGEIIARFETVSVQHKLERAKLSLFNNTREYESQLLGYENLLKDKTDEQATDIRKKLKISSGMAGAELDIEEANYELSKGVIRAPFKGILADVQILPGLQVKPSQELFRIYDPSSLFLEIKVLESDIGLLKANTPAEIAPVSNAAQKYTAYVHEVNPSVDENGMVVVKLKIPTTGSKAKTTRDLFPGMNCTALIKIPSGNAVVVPKTAVVVRAGRSVVFTAENGKAKWKYVTTGRDNGEEIEIVEGLKGGEQVIISNNLQLADDTPVKVIQDVR